MRRSRRGGGLGARLFVSHFLVAAVVALTVLTAVLLVAPLFLGDVTGGAGRSPGQALLLSLLVAGLAAGATAAAASLLVSRRIVDSLRYVLDATRRVAAGSYGERVPAGDADDEISELSEGFNAMARALEEAERRRVEVISDVSHELRTPLSTLRGYLESLMGGTVEPSEKTFSLLYAETMRMERLVRDLRQLSRAEAGQLALDIAPVSPGEVADRASGRMRPLFDEKGVELGTRKIGEPPPVLADADRVIQVLTNLLDNALRHTPPGGRVTVEVGTGAGVIEFGVADTGEGIPAEHLPRVFERFYRADRSRSREGGGSGVGLSISRALVGAMGGEIRAESPGAGRGATFRFTLPAAGRGRGSLTGS
ncbi:HAMP domain-containing protein [Rubrobacter tropicus]|uniref:histidine kinase n=1 Tax=Rubrobacter tropicus TaxID=2653851 RepID=A0A6G8QBV4_9ACTN|nr:HAMP domain-containing sensor histidine kinase [Rubrobacter tropicus]QIN83975.1 HAMP domain-containing protein [Rubrobacter tropicus]